MADLLQEAIESLEKAKCDFWACPGPDKPFEDMMTCHTCYALQCLRKIDNLKKEINQLRTLDLFSGDSVEDEISRIEIEICEEEK